MSAEINDLATIIIPFYSHPEYLPQAIESALGQTYTHLEIIVVDDGSPHDVKAVIQPYLSDRRLHVIHQENQGVAAARNTGIQASHGAYLQFLDSDDWLAPEKIACHIRTLEAEPDVGLVFCPFHFVEEGVNSDPINPLHDPLWQAEDGRYFNTLWAANRMVVAGPLTRREWIERAGGFDTGNLTEDYELWLRLAALGCRMRNLPEALVYYRINPQGRSHDGRARARKVATRARILTLFPDLTAEATERAMETWSTSFDVLRRERQETIDRQANDLLKAKEHWEGLHSWSLQLQETITQRQEVIERQAEELVQARHDLEYLRSQITECTGLLHERDAIINQLEQAPPKRVIIRGLRQLLLPIGTRRYAFYAQIRRRGNTRRT